MSHRVAPRAEADLDDIWLHVAQQSGSMETASRLIDAITDRFLFLSGFPYAGRARDMEFGIGTRSFPVGEYVIINWVEEPDVFILRVAHGSRDLESLFAL